MNNTATRSPIRVASTRLLLLAYLMVIFVAPSVALFAQLPPPPPPPPPATTPPPLPLSVIYVPTYDPYVVFVPPRPGIAIAGAIHFGPGITIGAAFGGWGWWVGSGFLWPSHTILIDHRPWVRAWGTGVTYVHPYVHPWVRPVGPRVEVHRLRR